jgi:thymidylate kinase
MLIAIEGIDGVGKSTEAKTVATALGFRFVDVPVVNFV